ncbi:MAG TPA: methyltransferase domain-containing protein [Chloroflexota bacterium]|nr:methyltransferase domain-containing protein [Chloroflexota bacterium]
MRDLDTPQPPQPSPTLPPLPAFLVWLWGAEQTLAGAEVAAVAGQMGATGGVWPVPGHPAVAFAADPEAWPVLTRLGFARAVLRFLGHSADLAPSFRPDLVVRGSFAVRFHSLRASRTSLAPPPAALGHTAPPVTAAALAGHLWRELRRPRVDLTHPETELHVFATPDGFWWGQLLHAFDGRAFAARHPQRRPFWRSVALAPRKARCLVNLSGVRPGGRLLDPFCGTGSIPVEAALLGVRAYAADLDPTVVAGAARNVAHLGVEVALCRRDARAWSAADGRFDAIVSDLPYGRTASLLGNDRHTLYREFLEVAARILVPHSRAVLMVWAGTLPAPPPRLVVEERFYEVVNAGLTREVVLLRKTAD